MGKGCQYHLKIQCANQVRMKWGSINISYLSFFFSWMSKVARIASFISLPTTWLKFWKKSLGILLLLLFSLQSFHLFFFTLGVHSTYLIVGFAFNCVLVLIFSRLRRPSVLFTSPVILVRRICSAISSFLNWRPFRLFSWPLHWIKKLSFRKKLNAGHLE